METEPNPAKPSKADWFFRGACLLGIAMLAFLFGMVRAVNQAAPYHSVRDAWFALSAVAERNSLLDNEYPAYLWTPTKRQDRGLASYEPSRSVEGYTVYTSAHEGTATLVDNLGRVRHEWKAPFRKVWPTAEHVPSWVPDNFIHMRDVHVFPNGDLLAVYSTTANTPSGCGLAKLNAQSQVLWTFDQNIHHDFCVDDDGFIYALNHRLKKLSESDGPLEALSPVPIIEDQITILDPSGKELKTFSLLDALVESRYFQPILVHADRYGDVTHNNTVNLVGEEFAAHYPDVSAGDLMVCLRNLGLVAIISPDSGEMNWATTGPWNHPHDPDPLPNGNILIFDNYAAQGSEIGSAVVEFNPKSRQIEWLVSNIEGAPLKSYIRSRQQPLPGGNVLITESDQGRLLEVNRDGEVVWEFLNPQRGGPDGTLIPIVCGGQRYRLDELPFVTEPPKTNPQLQVTLREDTFDES